MGLGVITARMEQGFTTPGREQRRNWRFACQAYVSLYNLISQRRVPGQMIDLSISGCLVRLDEPDLLREGDVIEVSFSLHGFSIRMPASIRNIRPDQTMGIQFRDRGDSSNWQLARLMQELAQQSVSNQHPEPRQ